MTWVPGEWVGGSAGGTDGPSVTCYPCHNDDSAARSALWQFASQSGSLWIHTVAVCEGLCGIVSGAGMHRIYLLRSF